ncbi:MAG: hypothetical protein OXI15_17940 [Chromatiales bacterium]|nr:hypothetical protein [Chromatiales bacterium]
MKMLRIAALALVVAPFLPAVAPAEDDQIEISFSRASYSAVEGSAIVFKVVKEGSGDAVVSYETYENANSSSNNQATPGVDYETTQGELSFIGDETEKTFSVSTIDDSDASTFGDVPAQTEASEFFLVKLSLGSSSLQGGDTSAGNNVELVSPWRAAGVILNK